MPLKPVQVRMARTALNWSNGELARHAGVGVNTVSRFEQGQDVRLSSVQAMQHALEAAGIEFLSPGQYSPDGGAGVRLKPDV